MKVNIIKDKEYNKINRIAIPLLLNNIAAILIGIIDQAMIGRTSIEAFGAVGMVGTTINSITGVVGMTAVAVNILGARSKGERDVDGINNYVITNILLSALVGIVAVVISNIYGREILEGLYGLKGKVLKQGLIYMKIFSFTIGLNMILFSFSAYFKIINKTSILFYGNITASILNVVLNYILIFGKFGGPQLGVKGAAISSVVSLTVNLFIYYKAFIKTSSKINIKFKWLKNIKKIVKISMPLIGQELLEDTILVIVINGILYRIGLLDVAIYNLVFSIISLALMPMYSYSQVALTLISEKVGQKKIDKINSISIKSTIMIFIFYFIISTLIIIFKEVAPKLITNEEELIKASVKYLPLALSINLFNILQNVYKQSLQGFGEARWVFRVSVLINFIGITGLYIFSIILIGDLKGVYIGKLINYIMLFMCFYVRFKAKIPKKE
ncbi:MATE family efflux transporter [Clostridiaceae bacterium M8S5]|nr:MATE family efflux transporter [Clostridiaceae bacterium M8S5]